ncbi:alkaline phosphatase D family protein [Galbibacter sp. BG1]|uniref:alkaline phosphatase D family protein n=1 Tax=Galbibacter sp. BG1 TaxID=1170699 RepID=UPI001C7086FE|nr:alkaline phosphatase D family protein [Galbibacter sp. BG1]
MEVSKMDGAVVGTSGEVKILLKSPKDTIATEWEAVAGDSDFTLKKVFSELSSNTIYAVEILGRKNLTSIVSKVEGRFRTAPKPDEITSVFFTSSTCQYFWSYDDAERGFKIYDSMESLAPDFHCQTGDYIYYDKPGPMATNVELARHKWHAMNAWPSLRDFLRQTPIYQQKDDHDLLKDDATPFSSPFGDLSYEDGLKIWREQVPIEGKPYRTVQWGKDLQLWFVENREYRTDPNAPNPSIWGTAQILWFKETILKSKASFKILVSPTPIVGPDRSSGKKDNHANTLFEAEGDMLRDFLATNNVIVINGDRHWQYVSKDEQTRLWEISQGPSSDEHAQGWNPEDKRPEHRFLRVKGGFLTTKILRKDNVPTAIFTHYDVDGKKVHQEIIKAKL